jgi:hypothetical protein
MSEQIKKALKEIDELRKYLKKGERFINFQIDRDNIRRYLKRIERNLKSDSIETEKNETELIKEQHELFDIAKESENVVKIIIEKDVDFSLLHSSNTVEDYNAGLWTYFRLTQSEFDLVKKVVESKWFREYKGGKICNLK